MQILSLQRKVIRTSLGRRARITREMFYFSVISLTGNLPTWYIYIYIKDISITVSHWISTNVEKSNNPAPEVRLPLDEYLYRTCSAQ